MKALAKLWGDLVGWRWAPAVGLSVASLFYVLVVVALVPDEIGVPMTNARFSQKRAPAEAPEAPTFPTAVPESEMPAPPPSPVAVQQAGAVDFGRRGFSPPLERADPPPAPAAPPPPVVPPPAVPPPPVAATPPPQPGAPVPPDDPLDRAGPVPTPTAAPTPAPVLGGLLRSMQAFRGGAPHLPANPAPGAPPGAAPTPPGQQPPPEAPAPPPGR